MRASARQLKFTWLTVAVVARAIHKTALGFLRVESSPQLKHCAFVMGAHALSGNYARIRTPCKSPERHLRSYSSSGAVAASPSENAQDQWNRPPAGSHSVVNAQPPILFFVA